MARTGINYEKWLWGDNTVNVHNYVCIYAYLCEYCMMGRWPLCTINF